MQRRENLKNYVNADHLFSIRLWRGFKKKIDCHKNGPFGESDAKTDRRVSVLLKDLFIKMKSPFQFNSHTNTIRLVIVEYFSQPFR